MDLRRHTILREPVAEFITIAGVPVTVAVTTAGISIAIALSLIPVATSVIGAVVVVVVVAKLASILNSILEMALTVALESLTKLADISIFDATEESVLVAAAAGAEIGRDETRSQSDHLRDLIGGIGGVSLSTDKSLGCSDS